jgi:hypothetical protein
METWMDLEPIAESPAKPDGLLRSVGRGSSRIPGKALLVLGLFLLVAALMALRTAMTREDCGLRLKVQHGFLSTRLSVWLDGGLVYSGRLIGSRKPIRTGKKKVRLVEPVEGSLSEMLSWSNHHFRSFI